MIFVILLSMVPSFDRMSQYFMIDRLGFTPISLSDFMTISEAFFIVGLVAYYYYFIKLQPRSFFITTTTMLWIINISFILVVLDMVEQMGMSNYFFCMANFGIYALVAELNHMPPITIWCDLCPDNLEASSITLCTGLMCLSSTLG